MLSSLTPSRRDPASWFLCSQGQQFLRVLRGSQEPHLALLPVRHSAVEVLTGLCSSPPLSCCFCRECARKCSSSRVASTSTWKSFLMVFTKGSCLFLMSVMPCPTTVKSCQVGQPRPRTDTHGQAQSLY